MPSKADITKAHILDAAAALFNQQGYAGTSMADLMAATGLKKGGIYNHFRNKDDIALAAFDLAVSRVNAQFMGAIRGQRHAVDRLMAILQVYRHMADAPPIAGGCPILNTAIDSDDVHPALRDRARQAMDNWRQLIHRIVEKGKQRGELRPDLDPEEASTVIIATIEGAVMLSKLYGDTTYMERTLRHLQAYVQTQRAQHA
jgi:TetR/AcrR family transcriptional repressor of nem operon